MTETRTSRTVEATKPGLDRLKALAALDQHLAVSVTTSADGSPQVAVVNIGVIPHPSTGALCAAFVARRGAKLVNLRRRPQATLVVRAGWEWIAVSGAVALAGPDDVTSGLDHPQLRTLLREIFHAAGGVHADLAHYDDVMAAERRCAVLVSPERFVTNPSGSEHKTATP